MPSSSFFSAVKVFAITSFTSLPSTIMAFAIAFMYYALCKFLLSYSSTLLIALLFFTFIMFLGASALIPEIIGETFLPVLPYLVAHYLLGDLDTAYEKLFFITAPAPAPAPVYTSPSLQLQMAQLSAKLEGSYFVSPPRPVKLKATDLLPAWYPASFPPPPTPPPRSPLRYHTMKSFWLH
ncbi:hypothetical protein B9Z19DRAFT_1169759 [Tuber borchii]|uniref:Uncharacterized protein n=1 Tax=Tuber borchii TaxID=42251 RepID=A0A2T6ZZH3_TUBBO|nr:hypothetical protein B9Z19DRAFT_1169759 [Tuber borchii]